MTNIMKANMSSFLGLMIYVNFYIIEKFHCTIMPLNKCFGNDIKYAVIIWLSDMNICMC